MRISVDLNRVQQLVDSLVTVTESSARPAAQAGAQILYDEARRRAPVYRGGRHYRQVRGGRGYWVTPGQLRNAIYQVFSVDNSGGGRATYHISWNHSKAPHGHWMEYGNARHPARPFIRPAFDSKAQQATAAVENRLLAELDRVIAP